MEGVLDQSGGSLEGSQSPEVGMAVQSDDEEYEPEEEEEDEEGGYVLMARARSGGSGKRHTWSAEEDQRLRDLVRHFGPRKWGIISTHFRNRNAKQCHQRWHYVLKPNITRQPWTDGEDAAIVHYQLQVGNKWSHIAKCLPGRTGYAIRNRYNFLTKRSLEEARRHLRAPAPLFLPPTALHHYAAHMAHQHQQQQQQMQYEQGEGQGQQWQGQSVGGMASGAGVVSQYSAHEQGGEEEEGGHRDSKRRRGEDGVGQRQEQRQEQGMGQSEHPLSSLMPPNYFTDLQHTLLGGSLGSRDEQGVAWAPHFRVPTSPSSSHFRVPTAAGQHTPPYAQRDEQGEGEGMGKAVRISQAQGQEGQGEEQGQEGGEGSVVSEHGYKQETHEV